MTALSTAAVPVPGGYAITGIKRWISFATMAAVFLVFARTPEGISAFLVERDQAGLEIVPMPGPLGARASMLGELRFTSCVVPRSAVLGPLGRAHPFVADDAAVRRAAHDELVRPFRLDSGLLVKFRLYRLAADHHIFLVIVHHLIADATSIGIMQADIAELYLAASSGRLPEPAPGLRYREFVAEQRAEADAAWRDELREYWASAFAGLPDPSHRRPGGRNDGLGPVVRARIATEVADAVTRFSRAARVTEFVVLVSAVRLLLWHATGGDDVLIAVPASSRDYPGTENAVGLFLTTLMLRSPLTGKTTFGELVATEWVTFLAALDHKDTPYQEMLMAASSGGMTDLPPAAVTFSYRLADRGLPTVPGLEISDFEFGETSLPSGLVVETIRDSAGYDVFVGYDHGLFARKYSEVL